MCQSLKQWIDELSYLRFKNNWHKQKHISKLMCYLGRHDFEIDFAYSENHALLKCFYCNKMRDSFNFH